MNMTIYYGSETGTAQGLASTAGSFFEERGHTVNIKDLEGLSASNFKATPIALVIKSTWGDGETPSNASVALEDLQNSSESLTDVSFAVFGVGSDSFPMFCQAAIDFDEALSKLGAKQLSEVVKAGDDSLSQLSAWLDTVHSKLG